MTKNTQNRAREEVVQLYIHDEVASLTRPVKELEGFKKISLSPGESKKVRYTLSWDQMKSYNRSMGWIAEPVRFKVIVGPSSAEGLEAEFEYKAN